MPVDKLHGRVPIEDLENWVFELEDMGASNVEVGKFFYDHLKRNIKEWFKEGKSNDWVVAVAVREAEKLLKRKLTAEELKDIQKRVEKFREILKL